MTVERKHENMDLKKDHLVKATSEGVRIYAAITTGLIQEAVRRHDCYPVASAALGRTMTGALLLAANLKNEEAITIKFNGDGPLGSVVADAVPEGYVRGYVVNPHVNLPLTKANKLDVGGGVGWGMVSVTRFTGLKEPVTGSTELVNGEIAEDIIRYLYVSEQTPSSVGLGVLVNPDLSVAAAGGFFIQPLPDAGEDVISRLEENLKGVDSVTGMVTSGLDARGIIDKLMDGFDVKYLSETELAFRCQCSKERIEEVLASLGKADMDSLIEDGHAEVCCHFCGEKYEFSREELEEIRRKASKG